MIISNQRLNRPMSSEESHNVDEKSMIDILRSMGIENFDPALPAALNEYARRFASEILCDAKDYSVHACRNEINSSDLATALKLCTTHLTGPEQKEQIIIECRNQINKRSLVDLVNQSAVLHHLPERALIQRYETISAIYSFIVRYLWQLVRSVTYTPWSEAFGEVSLW